MALDIVINNSVINEFMPLLELFLVRHSKKIVSLYLVFMHLFFHVVLFHAIFVNQVKARGVVLLLSSVSDQNSCDRCVVSKIIHT